MQISTFKGVYSQSRCDSSGQKNPGFSDFWREFTDFRFLDRFLLKDFLSLGLSPPLKNPVPHGSPIIVLFRKSRKKSKKKTISDAGRGKRISDS